MYNNQKKLEKNDPITLPIAEPIPVPMIGTADPINPPKNPPIAEPAEDLAFDFMDSVTSFPFKTSTAVPTAKETNPDIRLVFNKLEALFAIEFFAVFKKVYRTFFDDSFYISVAVGVLRVMSV